MTNQAFTGDAVDLLVVDQSCLSVFAPGRILQSLGQFGLTVCQHVPMQ